MIPALRDVSLIILIIPTLLCLLIPLVILGGSVWLMGKGNKALRPKLQSAHRLLRKIEGRVDGVTDQIAKPFISLEMRWVQIRTFWSGALARRKRMKP